MVHGQGTVQAGAWVRTRGHEGCNGVAQGLGPGGREGDRLSWYRGCEGRHVHGTSGHSSQASWVPGCMLVSGRQGGTSEGWQGGTSEGQQGAVLDMQRMDRGPGCVDWGWDTEIWGQDM